MNFYKKIYLMVFPLLVFISLIYFFKSIIYSRKLKILNNLYFNLPISFITKRDCNDYYSGLKNYLDDTYSVSIIDKKGFIIFEHNSKNLRIPASNQKLLSTSFVFNNSNIESSLKTSLYIDKKNNYYLSGSGDPDLLLNDLLKLVENIKYSKSIKLYLLEINKNASWPDGWSKNDKLFSYGSPITKLAVNSNSSKYININFISNKILDHLQNIYPNSTVTVDILDNKNVYKRNLKLFKFHKSNNILSLITLANAESHNYTAESLYKNSSNTWNENEYNKIYKWLKYKGLPVQNSSIYDASGLSRKNRVTTNLVASLLHKMTFNNNYNYFSSSLSIYGVRGTLGNVKNDRKLIGKFFGKTGTLSNVFALSGYLYKKDDILSLSIIQNSRQIDKNKVFSILSKVNEYDNCR